MLNFRIFISSTFADFEQERAVLQEVFDSLRPWCAEREARLEVIDLRWGVNEGEQRVHGTLDLCLDEIRHCHTTKPRPNFIILSGDRYGWCPVPSRIDAGLWEGLMAETDAERQALDTWYAPDESLLDPVSGNPQPSPTRVLQPFDDNAPLRGAEDWDKARRPLRAVLARAAGRLSGDSALHLVSSATHQEIWLGALKAGCEPPLLFLRAIEGTLRHPTPYADPPDADLPEVVDTRRKELLATLQKQFGDTPDTLAVSVAQSDLGHAGAAYLRTFAKWVRDRLRHHVESQLREAHGAVAADDPEGEAHATYGAARLSGAAGQRTFVGRTAELTAVRAVLAAAPARPLLLLAPGGSGKTALVAEAARAARAEGLRIVERYAGATPASLSSDLTGDLGMAMEGGCDAVFVDGLDLLDPDMPARLARFAGERGVRFCASIRLEPGQVLPDWAKDWDQQPLLSASIAAPPAEILDAWMRAATLPRRLVGVRRTDVLERLGPEALPLAVRIAAALATRPGAMLPTSRPATLAAWVEAALDDAEAASTPVLARTAIEALALSRFGLSRDELADFLWDDPAVRTEFEETRHWDWNDARLPPILLSRVLDRLQPVLIEAESDGASTFRFLHREFQDAAVRRAEAPAARLGALGRFFARLLPRSTEATLSPPIRRALLEAPRALIGAGDLPAMVATLLNLRFVVVKAGAGMLTDLFEDLRLMAAHTASATALRAFLGTVAYRLQELNRVECRDYLVQAAADMPPDSLPGVLAQEWLREEGADHLWLKGPVAVRRPLFTEGDVRIERVTAAGKRLASWGGTGSGSLQLDLWNVETAQRVASLPQPGIEPDDRTFGIAPTADGCFWTWLPALAPSELEAMAKARPKRREQPAGAVRLWREHATDPALDRLELPALCWCRPLPDNRLLACDWSGTLRVLRAAGRIDVEWCGQAPDAPGRHHWEAAGLRFDVLRTEGSGSTLAVRGSGWEGRVEDTIPEPGTAQTGKLLTLEDGAVLAHPAGVFLGLHPHLLQFRFMPPVATRYGTPEKTLLLFRREDGAALGPLRIQGTPLGALAAQSGALIWTERVPHPADPDGEYEILVFHLVGAGAEPRLLRRVGGWPRWLQAVEGQGLWLIDAAGRVILFPLAAGTEVEYAGSAARQMAALPDGRVVTWTGWGSDENSPDYGDGRVSVWGPDGVLHSTFGTSGIVRGAVGLEGRVVACLEDGTAVRIDLDAGSDAELIIHKAEWCGRDRLLAAELGGGLVLINARTGRRRPIPGTTPGDDVCQMARLPGGWVVVERGRPEAGSNQPRDMRTEVYDSTGACREAVKPDAVVRRVSESRLLLFGGRSAPEYLQAGLVVPEDADLLACGAVLVEDEDGEDAAFDGYAGLPVVPLGLRSLPPRTEGTHQGLDWDDAVSGDACGFKVEATARRVVLSAPGTTMPPVSWTAPREVILATPHANGAFVLLDNGKPQLLVLFQGNFPDWNRIRATARAAPRAAPVQKPPSDASLFGQAEALHDRSVSLRQAEWENGRGGPAPVSEAILNRWRLASLRPGETGALAERLADALPPDWAEAASIEQAYGLLGLGRALLPNNPERAAAILDAVVGLCARVDHPRAGIRSTLAAAEALAVLLNRPVVDITDLAAANNAAWIKSQVSRQVQSQRRRRGMMHDDEFVEPDDVAVERQRWLRAEEREEEWRRQQTFPPGHQA